jgi:hypothetical protein
VTEPPVEGSESVWGVTVEEIGALTPHITIYDQDVTDPAGDLRFGASQRRILRAEVEQWIADVSAMVDMRLFRRTSLPLEAQTRISAAAKAVVVNGVGSYLVAAAMPNKAGINENSSYSAELWRRYQLGLEELVGTIDGWLVSPVDPPGQSKGQAAAAFPPVRIGDVGGW